MEKEINRIHKRLRRSKFAVFLIIAFLALLTYLLIVVAGQVTTEEAINTQPRAMETQIEQELDSMIDMSAEANYRVVPDCSNYKEWIEKMREDIRRLAKKLSYRIRRDSGDILYGSCYEFIPGVRRGGDIIGPEMSPGPTWIRVSPQTGSENIQGEPGGLMLPELIPEKCSYLVSLYFKLQDLEEMMEKTCKSCPRPGQTSIDQSIVPNDSIIKSTPLQ